jgi:hypothetical protein
LAIAESAALANGVRVGIHEVLSLEEVSRPPVFYAGPDLARCWIAYVDAPIRGIHSSTIVLVDRGTGVVQYVGSANDEG